MKCGKKYLPSSLRGQLLALLAVVLVPALLVQLPVYVSWYHARVGTELGTDLELARSTASLFGTFVRDITHEELTLGMSHFAALPLQRDDAQDLLRVAAERDPLVDTFHWATAEGEIVASNDPKAVGVNIKDEPYFQALLAKCDWVVSDLTEDARDHTVSFVVAQSIPGPQGQLAGVLLASINRDNLAPAFASISSTSSGRLTLFDRQGHLALVQPRPESAVSGRQPYHDLLLDTALKGKGAAGRFVSPLDGTHRLGAFVPVAETGWVAGVSIPAKAVMAPLIQSVAAIAVWSALVIAVSTLAAMALYRRISAGLSLLLRRVESIGKGEIEQRDSIHGVTEFDTVAAALNRMAEDLRSARDDLHAANAALERRVEARTAELSAASESLVHEMTEREKARQELLNQSRILEVFYKHSLTPLVFLDTELRFIRVNEAYAKACGKDVSEFPGHRHFDWYPSDELERQFRQVIQTKHPYVALGRPFVFPDHADWGLTYWNLSVSPLVDASGNVELLVFSLDDVTQRTLAEQRIQVVNDIQALFTTKTCQTDYLDAVVTAIRNLTGCQNVGIRVVNEQNHIPYASHTGFGPEFMERENDLSLDSDTCICVRAVRAEAIDSDFHVMTPGGSFHCDNTTEWLNRLTPKERACYRGICVSNGYASVAVVPVRHGDQPVGAIHVADARPAMVSLDKVECLESIAPLVGEAIHRFGVEEALRTAHDQLEQRVRQRTLELQEANMALRNDIALRETAEEALSQSEERYRSLVESASIAMCVHRHGLYVYANPAAVRLFHATAAHDLIGRKVLDLVHPDERAAVAERIRQATDGRTPMPPRESLVMGVDGHITEVETVAIPIVYEGEPAIHVIFRDISERKQVERLQAEHIRSRDTLIRVSEDIVAQTSTEGVLQRVADAMRQLTGARLSTAWHGFLDDTFRIGATSRAEGVPACPEGETFVKKKGGVYMSLIEGTAASIRLTDAEMRAHPAWWGLPPGHAPLCGLLMARMVAKDGRPMGLLLATDKELGDFTREDEAVLLQLSAITSLALQHIEARQKAEEGARILDALMEHIPEGVTIADAPDVTIRMMSRQGMELNGIPRERFEGAPMSRHATLWEVYEANGVTRADPTELPVARAVLRGEVVKNKELVLVSAKDKRRIPLLCDAAPIRDAAGHITGGITVWRDITDMKRVEEALRVLASFPAENPSPVIRITRDFHLSFSNAASAPLIDLWNCRAGESLPSEIQAHVTRALDTGENTEMELACHDRVYSLLFAPFAEAGYVNIYGRDVTERKRVEDALRRTAEDLERSNSDLEQFAYVASHDLQEPLRMISGFVQLIEKRYKNALDKDGEEFIGFVVEGCARMQSLIIELLAYSRVGTRGSVLSPVDCNQIVERTITDHRVAIEESHATIRVETPLPTLVADPTQLVQLFQNLVGNAIKFRKPDTAPEIAIGARDAGGEWLFWVRDNGIGIDPRYTERIFVIFQRLHQRGTYPGNGMGLAICKKIVERHGGHIHAESELGQGSTFVFSIAKSPVKYG